MTKRFLFAYLILFSYSNLSALATGEFFQILKEADAYRKSSDAALYQPLVERLNSFLTKKPLVIQSAKENLAVESYLKKFPTMYCGLHSNAFHRKRGKTTLEISITCRNLALISSFYAQVKVDENIKLSPEKQEFTVNAKNKEIHFSVEVPRRLAHNLDKTKEYAIKIALLYHADAFNERLISRFLILGHSHLNTTPKSIILNQQTMSPSSNTTISTTSTSATNFHNYRKRITVYFRADSSQLTGKGLARLQKLRLSRNARVTIDGYSDNAGSKRANYTMALKRAQMVARYLKRRPGRHSFKVRSYGQNRAKTSNRSEKGRKKNRRVVVTVW